VEMRVPVPGLRGVKTANADAADGAVASRSRRQLQNSLLGDWEMCINSSDCKSQCCSNKWSRPYKCTPVGGFKPEEGCRNSSRWKCLKNGSYEGSVTIWWGHELKDGTWACDNWIEKCGNSCQAYPWI
jgi:hypothetical protein